MAEELDISKAIEQVKQMLSSEEGESQIQGIFDMLKGEQLTDDSAENADKTAACPEDGGQNSSLDILSSLGDIDMLMKLQSVMGAMGNQKTDANANFLQALKPLLSKERQNKLDNASRILSLTKILKTVKDLGIGGG